jgi:hypothetical protein
MRRQTILAKKIQLVPSAGTPHRSPVPVEVLWTSVPGTGTGMGTSASCPGHYSNQTECVPLPTCGPCCPLNIRGYSVWYGAQARVAGNLPVDHCHHQRPWSVLASAYHLVRLTSLVGMGLHLVWTEVPRGSQGTKGQLVPTVYVPELGPHCIFAALAWSRHDSSCSSGTGMRTGRKAY